MNIEGSIISLKKNYAIFQVRKVSNRTFLKFKAELYSLFYDYHSDYNDFRKRGGELLDLAYKHREISGAQFMILFDIYENMCSCLAFAFLED